MLIILRICAPSIYGARVQEFQREFVGCSRVRIYRVGVVVGQMKRRRREMPGSNQPRTMRPGIPAARRDGPSEIDTAERKK